MRPVPDTAIETYTCPACGTDYDKYHSYASHWWAGHENNQQHALCAFASEGVLKFLYEDLCMSSKEMAIKYGVSDSTMKDALHDIDKDIMRDDELPGTFREEMRTRPLIQLKKVLEEDLKKVDKE
jgi:hypothetical protein